MVVAVILLGIFLAAVLGSAYFAYRITFFSPSENRDAVAVTSGAQYDPYREVMRLICHQLQERDCEDVTIVSRDGLRLHGRYYHVRDGAPLDIGFHGYRSCPLTDFSGGAELSFTLGHNLLLVDQRAHGKSEGKTITFGILERQDCLDWVDWAIDRFGENVRIIFYGISMGATTVLMASELPLPKNVKGIIADCPYCSPAKIIRKVCADMRLPARAVYPFVKLGAWLYGGFRLEETDAARAVKHAKLPILIIHGESDSFVPCEMSEEMQRACPEWVQRHTIPGAEHGISYLVDQKTYTDIVTGFVKDALA